MLTWTIGDHSQHDMQLWNWRPWRVYPLEQQHSLKLTAVSTNFNVATQETSALYGGFLKPIDMTILAYFIRQGYPRELLFWLFADSFELNRAG